MNILYYLGGLLGGLISLKFLVISHIRINRSLGVVLFKALNEDSSWQYVMQEELTFDKKEPNIYTALYKYCGIFLLFNKTERLYTAGWVPKEAILDIYFFRWDRKNIKQLLSSINKRVETVNSYALAPYGNINIGTMDCLNYSIVADKWLYEDIELDILRVMNGEISKTSAILHGAAGNGKSRFVKYISQKYGLSIYTVYFSPDYTNLEIVEAFSTIPPKSIVLFEDFDNYFKGRKCIIPSENIKFTFDVLLNCLDGVYNEYKETIFFMTVNELEKVDDALKKRPSRFKFVREFTNPSLELKTELLDDAELADAIGDISLDQVFKIKDFKESVGQISIEEAKALING